MRDLRVLLTVVAAAVLHGCAAPAALQAMPAPESQQRLQSASVHPDAPDGVMQFGQLVGQWDCAGSGYQADGSWQPNQSGARWGWYWIMDGQAVQDVWKPNGPNAGPKQMGTNVRLYDPEDDRWNIVWGVVGQPTWTDIGAQWHADERRMVMRYARPKSAQFSAHEVRITFFNIQPDAFDWTYEFSPPGDGKNWTPAQRLDCVRAE